MSDDTFVCPVDLTSSTKLIGCQLKHLTPDATVGCLETLGVLILDPGDEVMEEAAMKLQQWLQTIMAVEIH